MIRRVALGLSLLFVIGCDGYTGVRGVVLMPDRQPVVAATVRLESSSGKTREDHTAMDGSYIIGITHAPFFAGQMRFTVTKEAYMRFEKELSGNERHRLEVVLTPATPAVP